jgi:hypothetical protein
VTKDAINTASKFDVFAWWYEYGRNRFPYMEVCALIVFAKPIHNGFQEQVFSRGTFTDDQLRSKMKESTVEIAILEAINCDVVDWYMESYKQQNNTPLVSIGENADQFLKIAEENSSLSDDESTKPKTRKNMKWKSMISVKVATTRST